MPGNITLAARGAEVTRQNAYRTRNRNKKFRRLWEEALDEAVDLLDGEARRRATGMKKDVWYAGRVVGTENVYDSALLMFLLRAHRPRVYRDNVAVEHSGGMEVTGDRKVTFELVRPAEQHARTLAERPELAEQHARTLYVFVVIDHGRRRIRHWNVTEHPIAPWIWQQMIEATAWGQQPGFLIRDRDRSYGGDFIARARRLGIETILTPVRVPNANAIAERVIGTLRRECRDHVIAVNEQHLRRVLGEYVQHYNAMRPHRSLSLDSPEGRSPVQRTPSQRVVSKPVLGGLHHEYRWAA